MSLRYLVHCVLHPREYTAVDGKAYVREWFGKPKPIVEHLIEDHHLSSTEVSELLWQIRRWKNK